MPNFKCPCSPIAQYSIKPSYKNYTQMLVSPQPQQPSCPNPLLSLCLCNMSQNISEFDLHKTILSYIYILPNSCYQNFPALSLYHHVLPCQVPNALLSHCSILNQTFLQGLPPKIAGTPTFMSRNHSPPLSL